MEDRPFEMSEPVAPDIATLLNAFAIAANRVSGQVTLQSIVSAADVALLQALSTAVMAVGSEFNRVTMAQAIAQQSQLVQGVPGMGGH